MWSKKRPDQTGPDGRAGLDGDDPCTCGHQRAAHDHYRSGSDCGICGSARCAGFQLLTTPAPAAVEVPHSSDHLV